MSTKLDLMRLYLNYLFALDQRRLHGEKYGDTLELIKIYEEHLEQYGVKKVLDKKRKK